MPLLAVFLLLAIVVLASIALLPLTLLQRYRVGTARRPARGWLIAINLVGTAISVALFVIASAVTSTWVPYAFTYTLMGLAAGLSLGLLGLALTRWEPTATLLYYTPNRVLVLAITLIVTARVLYGFWRSWHVWTAGLDYSSWAAESGIAGSMAAGGVVLGYYLGFWLGVRSRMKRHRRRP
jgi:membrane associated rhomboid family serine protease